MSRALARSVIGSEFLFHDFRLSNLNYFSICRKLQARDRAVDHILLNLYQITFRISHSENRVEVRAQRHEHNDARPFMVVHAPAESVRNGRDSRNNQPFLICHAEAGHHFTQPLFSLVYGVR